TRWPRALSLRTVSRTGVTQPPPSHVVNRKLFRSIVMVPSSRISLRELGDGGLDEALHRPGGGGQAAPHVPPQPLARVDVRDGHEGVDRAGARLALERRERPGEDARDPRAMLAPADLDDVVDGRMPGLEREQADHRVARLLVVLEQVVDELR